MRTFANNDQRQGAQHNVSTQQIPAWQHSLRLGRNVRQPGRMPLHQRPNSRTAQRFFRRGNRVLPRFFHTCVKKRSQISTQNLLCHDGQAWTRNGPKTILILNSDRSAKPSKMQRKSAGLSLPFGAGQDKMTKMLRTADFHT